MVILFNIINLNKFEILIYLICIKIHPLMFSQKAIYTLQVGTCLGISSLMLHWMKHDSQGKKNKDCKFTQCFKNNTQSK